VMVIMRKKTKMVISLLLLHFLLGFNTIFTKTSYEMLGYYLVVGNFFYCLTLELKFL
jgi:hypothetical protein